MKDLDFEADGAFEDSAPVVSASDSGTKRLSELIRQQILIEDKLEELAEEQEKKTKELTRLRSDLVPGLMKELGFSKMTTSDGCKVEIKPVVQASLPKDEEKKSRALQWLRDSGCEDVIKNEVTASFGRGEDEMAEKLLALMSGIGIEPQRKISVHPQTLSALVRQMREQGMAVDSENLTLYEGEVAKIIRPKKKKAAF